MVKKDASHFSDVAAAVAHLSSHGVRSVPHLPAARFDSVNQLRTVLDELHSAGASSVLCLAGNDFDERAKEGAPFIRADQLFEHLTHARFSNVCIAGYPEGDWQSDDVDGDADISDRVLLLKVWRLLQLSHDVEIVTQFCFDSMRLLQWLDLTRTRVWLLRALMKQLTNRPAPNVSFRIGIPGPTSAVALLHIAELCNVRPLDQVDIVHDSVEHRTEMLSSAAVLSSNRQQVLDQMIAKHNQQSPMDIVQLVIDEIKQPAALPRPRRHPVAAAAEAHRSRPLGPSMFLNSSIDVKHDALFEPLHICSMLADYSEQCLLQPSTDLSFHFFPFGGFERTIDLIRRLQTGYS